MTTKFSSIIKDKAFVNYFLAIINVIVWTKVIKGGSFLDYSLIVVGLFALANILTYGKLKLETLQKLLFYFWLINIIFYTAGAIAGSIGIAVAMIVLLLRIVIRAVTSDYYKKSINGLVGQIKRGKEK